MGSARVLARGGDCEIGRVDHPRDPVGLERMLDADAPVELRHGAAPQTHVAGGVHRVVAQPRLVEQRRGAVDGPALDEARRIDELRRGGAHVEVPVRLRAQPLAAIEHVDDVRVRVLERELAAIQAADLAVVLVRAERRVHPAEPVEHAVEHALVDVLVAHVDDDRHAHDVLDAADAGERRNHQTFCACRSADWSDWMNASLELDAPEIMLMPPVNCADRASCSSIGSACWLMNTDRSVWFG